MTPIRPRQYSLALLLPVLFLAGCVTTTPPSPTPIAPVAPIGTPAPTAPAKEPAPVPVVVTASASIIGSEESSAMFDNLTAYVVAVDGQLVADGRDGWSKRITLPPGRHRLSVEFSRGVFAAKTDLLIVAQAGAVYQLKFATDAQLFGKNSYCEFWIVETLTGASVTGPLRVPLTRVAKPQ